jgi:hypothetical protein
MQEDAMEEYKVASIFDGQYCYPISCGRCSACRCATRAAL